MAVPSSIDLAQLARHFTSRDVAVTRGKAIPVELTTPLAPAVVIVVAAVGAVAFVAGLSCDLLKVQENREIADCIIWGTFPPLAVLSAACSPRGKAATLSAL